MFYDYANVFHKKEVGIFQRCVETLAFHSIYSVNLRTNRLHVMLISTSLRFWREKNHNFCLSQTPL